MAKRSIDDFIKNMLAMDMGQLVTQHCIVAEDYPHYVENNSEKYASDLLRLIESYGRLKFGWEFEDALGALVG